MEIQKKEIQKGLHILAADRIHHSDLDTLSSQLRFDKTLSSKRMKDDLFAVFRKALVTELDRQIQNDSVKINDDYDNNPFSFWYQHNDDLSLLANIAKSVLTIPPFSVKSERHFSIASQTIIDLRSCLDPDCMEGLVVLKETYINKMWPVSTRSKEHSWLFYKKKKSQIPSILAYSDSCKR